MKRRDFLERAGKGALAAALVPGALSCAGGSRGASAGAEFGRTGPAARAAGGPARDGFTAWSWVHGDRERDLAGWCAHFGRLREAGVGGVLVGGGDVERVAEAARAEGLRLHRWMWTLNRTGDAAVQREHPEWFTVSRNGDSSLEHPPYVGYYKWLCPTREPVRRYVAEEMARTARGPVDAVHLDYVRHCDVILPRGLWDNYGLVQDRELPEFDFCYCEVCRETFAAQDGRDPLEIPDPSADEAWRRFRWDGVTRLVEEVARGVHAEGTELSAAVFPTPTIARRLVRQAWDEWPVDAVFPMLYASFYLEGLPWIEAGIREGVAALGGRPLYAGLYLPDLDPRSLEETVRACRGAGASGVSFFQSEALTDDHLAALARALKT